MCPHLRTPRIHQQLMPSTQNTLCHRRALLAHPDKPNLHQQTYISATYPGNGLGLTKGVQGVHAVVSADST
jgi:hypothetical protein